MEEAVGEGDHNNERGGGSGAAGGGSCGAGGGSGGADGGNGASSIESPKPVAECQEASGVQRSSPASASTAVEDEASAVKSGHDDNDEEEDKEKKRRDLFSRDNLQRLLADALTYKAKVSDLETIVKCGGDVNGSVQRGLLPLHYAVHAGNLEGIRFLLDKGADVNGADDIGYRPVHLCARKGLYEPLKLLVENGACVDFFADQPDISEESKALGYLTIEPLNMAIENNHEDCARLLLTHGARPDHRYFLGHEINLVPLDNIGCLQLLLEFGADPNVFSRCGISPLMKACRQHHIRSARILVESNADVNMQPPEKYEQKTAIHFAIESGSVGITTLLIRNNALLSRPPGYHYSALHTAVIQDKPEFCELLLRWDASVDELTDESATPLQLACATPSLLRRQEIVDVLLRHGADVNVWSPFVSFSSPFLSPLTEYMRCATDCIQYDMVYSLVIYGARVSFKAASTSSRRRDPHGILHCIQHVKHRPDIFHLLVSVSDTFDADSIQAYSSLSKEQKDVLRGVAKTPRDLKTLVRLRLREHLLHRYVNVIPNLPVPQIVKDFLMCKFSSRLREL